MEYKPLSGREFPRFSSVKTFFRLPIAKVTEKFDVALVGVPFDGGVSYRPGARFAPTKIREASSLGRGFHWTRQVNFFEKLSVADIGDCPIVPISIEKTYDKIEKFFGNLLKNKKRFISFGGDHSTTLPILRALNAAYGKPLRFIHFDAHLDTYPAAWDCEYHHGSFLRHAIEERLIDCKKSLHIGIRGPLAGQSDLDIVKKHKMNVVTVDDIRKKGLEKYLESLPKFDDTPTYLSFDVDCLDPAYAPGTGTPVVGGLNTYETQRIIREMKIPNLVGADVVEVCPPYDVSDITSLAAMDTAFEILCLMATATGAKGNKKQK